MEGNEGGGRQVLCKLTVRTRRDGLRQTPIPIGLAACSGCTDRARVAITKFVKGGSVDRTNDTLQWHGPCQRTGMRRSVIERETRREGKGTEEG